MVRLDRVTAILLNDVAALWKEDLNAALRRPSAIARGTVGERQQISARVEPQYALALRCTAPRDGEKFRCRGTGHEGEGGRKTGVSSGVCGARAELTGVRVGRIHRYDSLPCLIGARGGGSQLDCALCVVHRDNP